MNLLEDEDVKNIASKYGVTVGQVLIRYHVDQGNAVIPKSIRAARISENLDILKFKLDEKDIETLNKNYQKVGGKGYRTCSAKQWSEHPFYPFPEDFVDLSDF